MASNDINKSEVTMADLEHGDGVRKITSEDSRDKKETIQNPGYEKVTPQVVEEDLDPSLPLNWSTTKKFYNMAIPSIICLVV